MPGASESQSESHELRCSGCNKCFAKEGNLECVRCGHKNVLAPDDVRSVAYHMIARAYLDSIFRDMKPVKITVVPTAKSLGYAHFEPAKDTLRTREGMKNEVIALCGAHIASCEAGAAEPYSHTIQRAFQIASEIVEHCDGKSDNDLRASLAVVEECYDEARERLNTLRPKIRKVAEVLLERGTLTGDEFEALMKDTE